MSTKITPRTLILFKSKAKSLPCIIDLKFVPYYEIFFRHSNFCSPFSFNFLSARIKEFRDILGSGRNHHSYINPPAYHLSDFYSYPEQETANSSEILVTTYMIAQCHNSEDHSPYLNFLRNLKPHIHYYFSAPKVI